MLTQRWPEGSEAVVVDGAADHRQVGQLDLNIQVVVEREGGGFEQSSSQPFHLPLYVINIYMCKIYLFTIIYFP